MITCEFENGIKSRKGLRHAVVDAVIFRDNKVLLVRRAKNMAREAGKYAIPGGYVDRDETTKQTAMREVQEETGYSATSAEFLFAITGPDRLVVPGPGRSIDDRQNICFVYQVEVGEKNAEFDGEVEEIKWFDVDKLPPSEEMAFDHMEIIQQFVNYKIKGEPRPIIFD